MLFFRVLSENIFVLTLFFIHYFLSQFIQGKQLRRASAKGFISIFCTQKKTELNNYFSMCATRKFVYVSNKVLLRRKMQSNILCDGRKFIDLK